MMVFWYIMMFVCAILIFIVLPICMLYVESSHEKILMRVVHILKWEGCIFIVSAIALTVSYFLLSKANIPYKEIVCEMSSAMVGEGEGVKSGCESRSSYFGMTVSFPIYLIQVIAFFGWILFILFAGAGLASLPIDMICAFRFRPRRLDLVER